jgi:DNA primase
MEAKEEIRSKLNIEDVIGEYVQLKRAGRNYKGLSPFNTEKTPSFMVSPEKHIWYDFSSNRGGDVFAFVMEVEGLDFRGALELLARKAGVDLSQFKSGANKDFSQKKELLYQVLDLAAKFYQQSMIRSEKAVEYVFKKRALSKEVVQQFRIGYSPAADDTLLRALLKRGFKEQDLRDAGLVVTRRGRPSDMFRGRMMVPLADRQGRIVGFTARLVDDQPNAPKYINTPQTMLYDKGRQVFGLHLAKEAIRRAGYVVIVEGNLDVVSSHQAGIGQVVAAAGTALTEDHLRSLSRLANDIRLSFDRDKAGIAATERAIGIASKLGLQLSIITTPDGYKDPDEVIQADPQLWLKAIEQPQDAVEWLLDDYATRYDLSTAEGKRVATTKALELVGQLQDPVEQEHYLKIVAARTDTSFQAVSNKLTRLHQQDQPKKLKESKAQPEPAGSTKFLYQDRLLALGLSFPEVRDTLIKLDGLGLEGGVRQKVLDFIRWLDGRHLADDILEKLQSDELRVKIRELQFLAEQQYANYDDSLYYEASKLSKQVAASTKTKQKDELARAMSELTDPQQREEANEKYKKLIKEIQELKH